MLRSGDIYNRHDWTMAGFYTTPAPLPSDLVVTVSLVEGPRAKVRLQPVLELPWDHRDETEELTARPDLDGIVPAGQGRGVVERFPIVVEVELAGGEWLAEVIDQEEHIYRHSRPHFRAGTRTDSSSHHFE